MRAGARPRAALPGRAAAAPPLPAPRRPARAARAAHALRLSANQCDLKLIVTPKLLLIWLRIHYDDKKTLQRGSSTW